MLKNYFPTIPILSVSTTTPIYRKSADQPASAPAHHPTEQRQRVRRKLQAGQGQEDGEGTPFQNWKEREAVLRRWGGDLTGWENEAGWQIQGPLPRAKPGGSLEHQGLLSHRLSRAGWAGPNYSRQYGHYYLQTDHGVVTALFRKIEEIEESGEGSGPGKRIKTNWYL